MNTLDTYGWSAKSFESRTPADFTYVQYENVPFVQIHFGNRYFECMHIKEDIFLMMDRKMSEEFTCGLRDESGERSGSQMSCSLNNSCSADVDILVLFTIEAVNALRAQGWSGTNDDLGKLFTYYTMINTNADLAASLITNKKVRLIYQFLSGFNYSANGNEKTDLFTLEQSSFLNNKQADLGVLVTNNRYTGLQGSVRLIGPNFASPYAVVEVETMLSDRVFQHEVGHLMGTRHQNDPNSGCNHAFANSTIKTITGTHTPISPLSVPRIGFYSNPSITVNGTVIGVANTNDNATKIKNTMCDIQNFRTAPSGNFTLNITSSSTFNFPLYLQANVVCRYVDCYSSTFTYTWKWNTVNNFTQGNGNLFGGNSQLATINFPYANTFWVEVTVVSNLGEEKKVVKKYSNFNPLQNNNNFDINIDESYFDFTAKQTYVTGDKLDILTFTHQNEFATFYLQNNIGGIFELGQFNISDNQSLELNVPRLKTGIYFLTAVTKNGSKITKKLLIQND